MKQETLKDASTRFASLLAFAFNRNLDPVTATAIANSVHGLLTHPELQPKEQPYKDHPTFYQSKVDLSDAKFKLTLSHDPSKPLNEAFVSLAPGIIDLAAGAPERQPSEWKKKVRQRKTKATKKGKGK